MCDRAMMMPPGSIAPMALSACAFSFPGRPDQVRHVRAFIAHFLDGHPAAEDAVLMVSELAANACAHSASGLPGGIFIVRAQVSDTARVCVEVEDQGSSGRVRSETSRVRMGCTSCVPWRPNVGPALVPADG